VVKIVQITAYVVLDRLVIQCVVQGETSSGARGWTRLVQEDRATGALDPDSDHDMAWLAAYTVCDRLTESDRVL